MSVRSGHKWYCGLPGSYTRKKREATHGLGSVEYGTTEIRDLPVRTLAERVEEWRAFFEKAWAQKREREAAEARGQAWGRGGLREGESGGR